MRKFILLLLVALPILCLSTMSVDKAFGQNARQFLSDLGRFGFNEYETYHNPGYYGNYGYYSSPYNTPGYQGYYSTPYYGGQGYYGTPGYQGYYSTPYYGGYGGYYGGGHYGTPGYYGAPRYYDNW